MQQNIPDPEIIRTTFRWLAHTNYGVSEVRIIRPGRGGIVGIGFFDDEDFFVKECVRNNPGANVYVGIQPRPKRFLDRAPNVIRPLFFGAGKEDIEVVTATVIDIDPERPKNTASTAAELKAAKQVGDTVAAWCVKQGMLRPQLMMSGNGVQLWFAVPPIKLTAANKETVKANLKAFEAKTRKSAENAEAKIDSIHDLPRIIKVIGTVSYKGENTQERPYRVSRPLGGFDRQDDKALAARLLQPVTVKPRVSSQRQADKSSTTAKTALSPVKARRTADGKYDFAHPVNGMCSPVQRLWKEGFEDRSVGIFLMCRYFMHKKLGIDEITDLVLEYDRRGGRKLERRNNPGEYIHNCCSKIAQSRKDDGSISPPCHKLQGVCFLPRSG